MRLAKLFWDKLAFRGKRFYYFLIYTIQKSDRSVRRKNPKLVSVANTLKIIADTKVSLSRFGDGEMRLMNGESIEFQQHDPKLAVKLRNIIQNREVGVLVCLPDVFDNLSAYTNATKHFWREHFCRYGNAWLGAINLKTVYYNSFITRPYMIYRDKSLTKHVFQQIKKVWSERDVLVVEGEKTKVGVGNDLLNNARTVKRILCPSVNAFSAYEQIIKAVSPFPTSILVLIALGPTATSLAFDLHLLGYQAIDIGHVDIEYEWYRSGAKSKIKIQGKYTNEAVGGNEIESFDDPVYLAQVIKKITIQNS